MPPKHLKSADKKLYKMLEALIVAPAYSACSFPAVIATEKDAKPRFRFNYGEINRKMIGNRCPFRRIQEIFDDFPGSEIFSTLDLFSGWWQILKCKWCKEKTRFVFGFGTFLFGFIPFGLQFIFYLPEVYVQYSTIVMIRTRLFG